MEKITIKFIMIDEILPLAPSLILTLDENGKHAYLDNSELMETIPNLKKTIDLTDVAPKRVMNAFTESAVNKILALDEIPNEGNLCVLDGNCYDISISKGELIKVYHANEATIKVYPLLRHLASWAKK